MNFRMKKNFKRCAFACMLSTFFAGSIVAQEIKIQGVVVDSLTCTGEPFATIRIYRANNNTDAVYMGTTDVDGHFKQIIKKAGDYHLLFSSVGRK